jgi:AraC-like DNA-binding protein
MLLLDQYQSFNTQDLDEARELVASKFCSHSLEIQRYPNKLNLRHNLVSGNLFSLNYIQYGATVLIEPGELENFYLIQLPLTGNADIKSGRYSCASNPVMATILNPDRYAKMVWHAGCTQIHIYIIAEILHSFVESFIGRSLTKPIVFDTSIDFERAELATWRKHVLALVAAADAKALFQNNNTLNQLFLEQELLAEFVTNQPSNIQPFIDATIRGPTSGYVKKARKFITDNAGKSIALDDIAKAAGVPGRTLQHGFKKAYNCSPMGMLHHERLMRVHHELASGHCAPTVTSTATKWGFFHLGLFSQYYRKSFGELPSETMLRANNLRLPN